MEHKTIESHVDFIVESLVADGFAILANGLSTDLVKSLRESSDARLKSGRFRPGGVGPQGQTQKLSDVRSDVISWLDETDLNESERALFAQMDSLRLALNQNLFLGLKNFEAHYARYQTGSFYRRHLDRFRTDDARTVSIVLYLNDDWNESDQGELRLYPENRAPLDVLPRGGAFICFMSDRIEHEVLPSPTRERISIAAWFRR